MKKLITTILLLSLVNISFAQKKEYKVELNIDKAYFNADFRCAQVIDKRIIKNNIGFAQIGIGNRKVPVNLEGEFSIYLKEKINQLFFGEKEKRDIIFIFHDLNVSERTNLFSEKGICKMEIEFAEYRDSVLFSLGSFYYEIEKGSADVTVLHGKRIVECLINCIKPFYRSDWKNIQGESINLNKKIDYDFNTIPPKGLYSSFNKLGEKNPMDLGKYKLTRFTGSNKIEQYKVKDIEKENNNRIMFISDGANIYMHTSRYCYKRFYVKSKHIGKYIYFEDKFTNPVAVFAFGALGAAATNGRKGVILDTADGLVYVLTNKLVFNLIKDHEDIYQEFKLSKRKLKDREKAILRLNALDLESKD